MNGIVSVNNKNELEDYKLIYPNNKKLKVDISDGLTTAKLRLGTTIVNNLIFLSGCLILIICLLLNMIIEIL